MSCNENPYASLPSAGPWTAHPLKGEVESTFEVTVACGIEPRNINLIAAAPELLAAVKDFAEFKSHWPAYKKEVDALKKLIDRAEGRAL